MFFILFIVSIYSNSYSDHMAQISGFESSLKKASEELALIESKFNVCKTRIEREVLTNDIKATKKNIEFYRTQIKVIERHITLEHTEEEKARYGSRYERNRRKEKVE